MLLDARDLFNPKPVIMALEALTELAEGESLAISVNSGKAVGSLMRLAEEQQCDFMREDEGEYVVVTLKPSRPVKVESSLVEAVNLMGITPDEESVMVLGSDSIGSGDQQVGRILMDEILFDFCYQEVAPGTIILVNSGVKLALGASQSVDALKMLAEDGATVLVDAVSLEFYGGFGELAVGEVVDPYVIAQVLTAQPGVVSL